MRRRDFITLFGGAAAAWPLAAQGQQPERMRRIGVLMYPAADDPEGQARIAAFLDSLEQLGWTDGRAPTFLLVASYSLVEPFEFSQTSFHAWVRVALGPQINGRRP